MPTYWKRDTSPGYDGGVEGEYGRACVGGGGGTVSEGKGGRVAEEEKGRTAGGREERHGAGDGGRCGQGDRWFGRREYVDRGRHGY